MTQTNQPFMFQVLQAVFIVAQVMPSSKWLSIIARSELGSDLDCYELRKLYIFYILMLFFVFYTIKKQEINN